MAVSHTQRLIAESLALHNVGEDLLIAILHLMKTPEQEERMLDYLLNLEEQQTENALLTKAVEIMRGPPILQDGKTLDELCRSGPSIRMMKELRAEGWTDEAIWEEMLNS